MTMGRHPVTPLLKPANGHIPKTAVWYPMHTSLGGARAGELDLPSLVALGTGHIASPMATPGFYEFPAVNATAGLGAPHDLDNGDVLDDRMTMAGLAAGDALYSMLELSFVDQATAVGMIWGYGCDATASLYGFSMTTAEVLQFQYRGVGASNSTSVSLTAVSGKTLADFKGRGRFALCTEILATGPSTVSIRALLGQRGAGWVGEMAVTGVDLLANSATAVPGRYDSSIHYGLTLGCRSSATAGVINQTLGNGAGNTAKVGNFFHWRRPYMPGVIEEMQQSGITKQMDLPLLELEN